MNAYTVTLYPHRAGLLWRFPVAARNADQARELAQAQLCMVRNADGYVAECVGNGDMVQGTLFQQEGTR